MRFQKLWTCQPVQWSSQTATALQKNPGHCQQCTVLFPQAALPKLLWEVMPAAQALLVALLDQFATACTSFQTSSPVARSPIAEQALVEQPGKQNWQLKEQQAVAQQTAAHQQLVLVEAVSSADAQAVVPQIKQAFRGGRPKKAAGAAKG